MDDIKTTKLSGSNMDVVGHGQERYSGFDPYPKIFGADQWSLSPYCQGLGAAILPVWQRSAML